MTDKELLELAAKAAGIKHNGSKGCNGLWVGHGNIFAGCLRGPIWNPLTDDGDALRLAVKLGMMMYIWQPNDGLGVHNTEINRRFQEMHNKDSYAATRRAIVRAAAEIGKAMP